MEEFYIKRNDKKVRKVRFKNENSIKEAFEKAGYKSSTQIIDDCGKKHNQIETFFGFSKFKKEMEKRDFVYLSINGPIYKFDKQEHSPECGWHKDWHNCSCGLFDIKK